MTESETLLTFPCKFPIKVMGNASQEFEQAVYEILSQHIKIMETITLKQRKSSNGNYLAITAIIEAESQSQLDAIYQALTAHELILWAL